AHGGQSHNRRASGHCIDGSWVSHRAERSEWLRTKEELAAGVELDDQTLLDLGRERDLSAIRQAGKHALRVVLVPVEVAGRVRRDLECLAHRDEVLRLRRQFDGLT